ncbi:MAG TPA: thiol:disulfide interchange protein DsbA/DsbL [Gammaproteobacteria bacterium]
MAIARLGVALVLAAVLSSCGGDAPTPAAERAAVSRQSPESPGSRATSAARTLAGQPSRPPSPYRNIQLAQADAASAPSSRFQEGIHYTRLNPPQPTSSSGSKVEVAEVFMYSCPGCFRFEPYVKAWVAQAPDYVTFVRIPAVWNELARLHGQAYYTAEALGKLEEMHQPFFDEIHRNRNLLDSKDKLRDFFGRFGVSGEQFDSTFESFAVHTKVRRAGELMRRYRVSATPTVVVNGEYVTAGANVRSYEEWFEVIEELAAREQAQIAAN